MKKRLFAIPMLFLTIGILSGCGSQGKIADLVLYDNIFTAEKENGSLADAIAVKDGKYIYVGSKEGAKEYIKEGITKVVDKENKGLIIPGATEGHSHYFDGVGLNSQLPGSDMNYSDVKNVLKEKVKEGITQFVSFGWNAYELNERKQKGDNFAQELEDIAPGIPVILIDNTGHGALCNKTALQKAGIDEDTVIRGGTIALDKEGKPSGFISDQIVFYAIEKAISKPLDETQYRNACEYGMNELLRLGYTNALDAFTNMYDPTGLYKALKDMDDAKELKINIAECYNIRSYDSEIYKTRVNEAVDIKNNYSSAHVHPEYIKIFTDGIVEAGSGWMIEPYNALIDGKKNFGNIIWNQPELDAMTSYANHRGLVIHAHTYGDAANKAMLDSFILSNELNNGKFRNCLSHVRNITSEDVKRAANNDIPIAANIIWHCDFDENIPGEKASKDSIIANIGEERYYAGYPMKSLLKEGVKVSSSTDAPAAMTTEGSIMNVLQVAVTGVEPTSNATPFASDELLTVQEGLEALTINGAWQLGLEKERGSIKVGKYADFVILDNNILDFKGEELRAIGRTKILSTYFEGEEVYKGS